eukprot:TRINITY_DN1568_c0_g3_i1.p2 TRINITY_DN1568_c0_g3~~TRINITY_DN1568_c0_g3_i1.p2  ORF type:complete len:372 (-),score=86.12 TRINITY_DN1568_c0_g3_i1:1212-2327(-)
MDEAKRLQIEENIRQSALRKKAREEKKKQEKAKKQMALDSYIKIGTHDGCFHVDEILACYLLRKLKKFEKSQIIRSRKKDELAKAGILVDVGGEYNPEKLRFDHHQRGFTTTLSPHHSTRLSSAGLIYKHYGHQVLTSLYPDLTDTELQDLYLFVYTGFIEELDAVDNGIKQYDTTATARYQTNSSLSARIGRMNPTWNTPRGYNMTSLFRKAMKIVGAEFESFVEHAKSTWLPAKTEMTRAFAARTEHDPSGQIIVLPQRIPWAEHLYALERESATTTSPTEKDLRTVKFIIFPGSSDMFRVRCVPTCAKEFDSRLPLPERWRGLSEEELSGDSIKGIVFVHANGFIGGNRTLAGALAMAQTTIKEAAAC